MYFKRIFQFISFFGVLNSFGNDSTSIKLNNPYFDYILSHPNKNFTLLDHNNGLLNGAFRSKEYSYIIDEEKITYKPIGTGYLFEIKKSATDGQLKLTRIDSTFYTGYNFFDFLYKKNDTIFSLGGQGFWNHNGHLRYYTKEKGEWEIIPIQRWFPVSTTDIVDLRKAKGKIYTYFQENKYNNVFYNQKGNPTDTVIVLNLADGSVTNIGIIENDIKSLNFDEKIRLETEYGIFVFYNGALKLLDFENNVLKEWKDIRLNNLFNSTKAEIKPLILRDSILIYNNADKMDSLVLPISKFKVIGNIYTPFANNYKIKSTLLFFFFIVIGIMIVIFKFYKKKYDKNKLILKKGNDNIELNELINKENIIEFENIFDLNEQRLLSNMILNHNKITVENLNYILGLDKKNMQVQKKNRSSVISSINIKFKAAYGINEELIQRIKDENDARNINYQISSNFIENVKYWNEKIYTLK